MIFILTLMLCIAWTRLASQWFFVNLILMALLLLSIFALYRFINQTHEDLVKLLNALKNNDFSLHFSNSKSKRLFANLHGSFNEVVERFRTNQLEKEAHKEFLKIAVDQIRVGVIAIDAEERILIFNEFARECLSSRAPTDWNILLMRKIPFVLRMEEMESGTTDIFNFKTTQGTLSLAIRAHTFVTLNQKIRLFTFQDIRDELDRQELASWHKVIRILTHEIMNSLTPVISLTETAEMLLNVENELVQNLPDIKASVHTAQSRAKGLLNFVRSYRQFLKVPNPQIARIDVSSFVQNIHQLFSAQLQQKNIAFDRESSATPTSFQGDQYLLEQVFINLFQNAIDAVEAIPGPRILFSVLQQNEKIIFHVSDNGPGVSEEILDKVFVPFFTTKEKGTGVGLSLSRQIVVGHGGRMLIKNSKENETIFIVELPIRDQNIST